MGLVGKTTRVDIPHEPGQWLEIRRLSWRELDRASDAETETQLARIKAMGGDVFAAIQRQAGEQKEKPKAASYDRAAVLRKGIVRWSYDEKVAPDNIDMLDEETAAWAVEQILALGRPRTEEETKNG